MKKSGILCCCFLLVLTAVAQQSEGVRFWEGSWAQAQQKAREEHKLIFLDCYTTWCGPCKRLAKNVFTQKELGDYYNSHFVSVGMDMEKGDGIELTSRFDVDFYPTLFVLNAEGYILSEIRGAGAKTAEDLLAWATEAQAHADSLPMKQRFDKGERKPEFMLEYAAGYVREGHKRRVDTILRHIVQEQGYAALYKEEYYRMLPVLDIHSPLAIYFVTHGKDFAKRFTEEDVYGRISEMYTHYLLLYHQFYQPGPPHLFMPEGYTAFVDTLKHRNVPDAEFIKAQFDFFLACRNAEFDKAYTIGEKALQGAAAWQYYAMAKMANQQLQKTGRIKAVAWAQKAARLTHLESTRNDCAKIIHELTTLPVKSFVANEGITTFRFP